MTAPEDARVSAPNCAADVDVAPSLRDALQQISDVNDSYEGGWSWQALYAYRAICGRVGIKPDDDVVLHGKPSHLNIEHVIGRHENLSPRTNGYKSCVMCRPQLYEKAVSEWEAALSEGNE